MGVTSPVPLSAVVPARSWADQAFAPADVLVGAIFEASPAELGWLAWLDGPDQVVQRGEASSPIEPADIGEFPDPPAEPLVVDAGTAPGPWGRWCRASSCAPG